MSFDAGAAVGRIELNVSGFTAGVTEAVGSLSIFPGVLSELANGPFAGFVHAVEGSFKAVAAAVSGDPIEALRELGNVAKEMSEVAIEAFKIFAEEGISAFEEVAHAAHEVSLEAERVGVSVGFLSGFGEASKIAGGSTQSLAEGLKFLGRNAAEAASGNKELVAAFEQIGLSSDDVKNGMGDLQGMFIRVAEGINGLGTGAEKTRSEMALLGRGGIDLAGVILHLNEVIVQQGRLERLGAPITESMAEAAEKVGTLSKLLSGLFTGFQNAFALPILQNFADHFDDIFSSIVKVSDAIRTPLSKIGADIAKFIPGYVEEFERLGISIGHGLELAEPLVKPIVSGLLHIFSTLNDFIEGSLLPVWRAVEPVIIAVAHAFEMVADAISRVGKFLDDHPVIGGIFSAVTGGAISGFKSLANAVNPDDDPQSADSRDKPSSIDSHGATPQRKPHEMVPSPEAPWGRFPSIFDADFPLSLNASGNAPALDSLNASLSRLSSTITGVLSPGIDSVLPKVTAFGDQISNQLSSSLTDLTSIVGPLVQQMNAAKSGGIAGPTPTATASNLIIEHMSIPGIDPKDASSAIAAKLQPAIEAAYRKRFEAMEGAAQRFQTSDSL